MMCKSLQKSSNFACITLKDGPLSAIMDLLDQPRNTSRSIIGTHMGIHGYSV